MEVQQVLIRLHPDLADTGSLSWCYTENFRPARVFLSCMNCGSHLSTSITVMIAQAFSSHTTCPQHSHRWHPLWHRDAAKSLTAAAKVAEGALKRSKPLCVHDYAGNKGLRVTGYNDGKCEAWERWEKQACSAQLPQLGCVPTKTRNTPLGGCWNNQTRLFIHTAKKAPGTRDVISEWNYGH